jgi:hypothetical protein
MKSTKWLYYCHVVCVAIQRHQLPTMSLIGVGERQIQLKMLSAKEEE